MSSYFLLGILRNISALICGDNQMVATNFVHYYNFPGFRTTTAEVIYVMKKWCIFKNKNKKEQVSKLSLETY